MLRCWAFAARNDRCFQKRYPDLCALLGIPCYAHRSKAIEKLGPSLEELRQSGYIDDWQIAPARDGDVLKVVLWTHPRLVSVPRLPASLPVEPERPKPPHPPAPPHDGVTRALTRRGITPAGARTLLENVTDVGAVERQVAYFDHVLASSRGGCLRNPAGFLISLIRDGRVPDLPGHEVAPVAPPTTNYYALLQAYRRYVSDAVQAHLAGVSDREIKCLVDEHLERVIAENPLALTWPLAQQRATARLAFESHLARSLPLKRLREFLVEHDPTIALSLEVTS
jgi:hypothetical protein